MFFEQIAFLNNGRLLIYIKKKSHIIFSVIFRNMLINWNRKNFLMTSKSVKYYLLNMNKQCTHTEFSLCCAEIIALCN